MTSGRSIPTSYPEHSHSHSATCGSCLALATLSHGCVLGRQNSGRLSIDSPYCLLLATPLLFPGNRNKTPTVPPGPQCSHMCPPHVQDGLGKQAAGPEGEQSALQKAHLSQHTEASGVTGPRFCSVFAERSDETFMHTKRALDHRPTAQAICYLQPFKDLFYECLAYTHVSGTTCTPGPFRGQKKGSEPLELGLRQL